MNPVLLKPETDGRSQVVVLERARGHLEASFREGRATLWPEVAAALDMAAVEALAGGSDSAGAAAL